MTVPAVTLRGLAADDAAQLVRIHSEPEVARWWGMPDPAFPWDEPRYRHAGIDLFVDPAVPGRGVGSEAVAQMVRRLVGERGHHRVTIDPASTNVAAIRAYERAGFRRVGVMRRSEREPDGPAWHDRLLMELVTEGP